MLKIVLVLLAVSTVATQQRNCPKFCEDCDSTRRCHACLKSKLINGKCEVTSNVGNCLVYNEAGNCQICAPGYAVVLKKDALGQQRKVCVENKIQNCQIAFNLVTRATDALSQKKTTQRCVACLGGYPTKDLSACAGWKSEDSGLEQQVNRCLWGGRFFEQDQTFCYRCKPGFATDAKTGKCFKQTLTGCLFEAGPENCEACNIFEGYYTKTPKTCTK